LHIRPPQVKSTISPVKRINNLELPLWESVTIDFTPKPPIDVHQFNDQVAQNHLKLKVTRPEVTLIDKVAQETTQRLPKAPFIMGEKPVVPIKSIVVMSKELQTSVKKACIVTNVLIGRYLYDAMLATQSIEKKVARFLSKTLEEECMAAIEKHELDPKYLFITSIVTNRTKRLRRIRYHARGRSGIKNRDFALFKITLSEKPLREFYKQLIQGNSPPYLSYLIKNHLIEKKATYEEVRDLQCLLHAKGRQQQKLMFKRKVMAKWVDFRRKGVTLRLKLLFEKMLEDEATIFEEKFKHLFESTRNYKSKRLELRKAEFERNQAESK
jgi:ribosomal protein L22